MVAAVAIVGLLSGCTSAGTRSPAPDLPSPSTSAPTTAEPTPVPSPSPTLKPAASASPPLPVAIDTLAVVVVNGLEVMREPASSVAGDERPPDSLGVLNAGRHVYVAAGPAWLDGRAWFQVDAGIDDDGEWAFGWVEGVGSDGTPRLLPNVEACDEAAPTEVWELAELEWGEGLACFSSRPLVFEDALLGSYETCGGWQGWTVTPAWLGEPQGQCVASGSLWFKDDMMGDYDDIPAVVAPGANPERLQPSPTEVRHVTIVGQFDHPAARTCRGVEQGEVVPMTPDQIVLACRATFVITAMHETQADDE